MVRRSEDTRGVDLSLIPGELEAEQVEGHRDRKRRNTGDDCRNITGNGVIGAIGEDCSESLKINKRNNNTINRIRDVDFYCHI